MVGKKTKDMLKRWETEDMLRQRGIEPNKPVSCMTAGQLFELIEFVINRNKN